MDKFEAQFEELDVRAGVMDSALSSANASSMPEEQIDSLMAQARAYSVVLTARHALSRLVRHQLNVLSCRLRMRTTWTWPPSLTTPLPQLWVHSKRAWAKTKSCLDA